LPVWRPQYYDGIVHMDAPDNNIKLESIQPYQ